MNKNTDDNSGAVVVGLALAGLAAIAGIFGFAVHAESKLTPAERAARDLARREAEQARREAEEQRRRELAEALVRPLRPRGEFDGVLEALLTGRPATVQTVALYAGRTLRGAPEKVLQITSPTQVGDFLLTPTADGVRVQWFGAFGPESRKLLSGEHEYLIQKRMTVAVL